MAQDDAPVFRTKVKRKAGGTSKNNAGAPAPRAAPLPDLLPRRSLMDALREANVSANATVEEDLRPPEAKKKRRSRAKDKGGSLKPTGAAVEATAATPPQPSTAKDQRDQAPGEFIDQDRLRKSSRGRLKPEAIFTPMEVEDAEVIIIRRR